MAVNKKKAITTFRNAFLGLLCLVWISGCSEQPTADLIFSNGRIYTADSERSMAEAIAVKGEDILYVGDDPGSRAFAGEDTEIIDLEGRLVVPGLHDSHIHPLGIVQLDRCDLESRPYTMAEMVPVLRDCIRRYEVEAGEWLIVEQWAFTQGNEPSEGYPNLRAALDAVSLESPVFLKGNDGHHAAANSAALATARNRDGQVVGINAETLATDFADYSELIGRDSAGKPNGTLNEGARTLLDIDPAMLLGDLIPPDAMPRVAAKLASYGITSVQDAAASPAAMPLYESLQASGRQTFRLAVALYPRFDEYRSADGRIDMEAVLKDLDYLRESYADNPLIRADGAKIFVDGVLEGNPLVDPPTLPNGAHLDHYLQPRFEFDPETKSLHVVGYVDPDSDICQQVRAHPSDYQSPDRRAAFRQEYGHAPSQCEYSRGVLEHPESFIHDYIAALDAGGYTVHAHAIGNRAMRTAIDAFAKLGPLKRPHNIAHAQLVYPDDIRRVGELGLFVTMTYAWVQPEVAYDLTVTPFIDHVHGVDDLYNPDHQAMRYSYPARSLQTAGAILAAGSDAPVDSREPRPFENIEQAVTRKGEGGVVWNADERLSIEDILDAYTINGARALRQSDKVGSLEVGKKADFAVLDQNILELARQGEADKIGDTQVLRTVFNGKVIFERD